jgi:hypothetical protein
MLTQPAHMGTVDSSGDSSQRPEKTTNCSHVYIDPSDPPIQRAPYSPVIGPRRREMKPGTTYVCQNCGQSLTIPHSPSIESLRSMMTD